MPSPCLVWARDAASTLVSMSACCGSPVPIEAHLRVSRAPPGTQSQGSPRAGTTSLHFSRVHSRGPRPSTPRGFLGTTWSLGASFPWWYGTCLGPRTTKALLTTLQLPHVPCHRAPSEPPHLCSAAPWGPYVLPLISPVPQVRRHGPAHARDTVRPQELNLQSPKEESCSP